MGVRRAIVVLGLAGAAAPIVRAATPVVVQNTSGFEGEEEPTVVYYPDTDTFQNDSFDNLKDEGGGMTRVTLRNNYSALGWWDGDRSTTNTDRQRGEWKGIVGLPHQHADETFEYSFDFRTNPGFSGTSHFVHIFQLKQTENGSSENPLMTVSLYKNSSGVTEGRLQYTSANTGSQLVARTFSFTANAWHHVVVRVTTTDGTPTDTGGAVVASVNGDAFSGVTGMEMFSNNGAGSPSDDYRIKMGFYRAMGTTYGVPEGDFWLEHRTVTGYAGVSKLLTWAGGSNANAWDTTTANFLNGAAASTFSTIDQVNFTDSSSNTSVNIAAGGVWPGYVRVNSSKNYTFTGSGAITGGTLRKDGTGTLTLANNNSYAGLTDVRAGTLFISGSIGNSSLLSIAGGTVRAGSSSALGTTSTIGTEINGGTLDINGFNLSTEPVTVQGSGVSSAGAIVNSGAAQTSALNKVTLSGNVTFGGVGRWDIRGTGAALGTSGNGYTLTKTGTNQVSLVGANVDAALGNITISQGLLAFQTSTTSMGDATKSLTVSPGTILGFYNTTSVMNKLATLSGGTMWAESGTGTQNEFAGPVTLSGIGGIFDAGGALTGGTANSAAVLNISGNVSGTGALTKNGPGTVTLSASNSYTGATTVNVGKLVMVNSFRTSASLSVANGASAALTPRSAGAKTLQLGTLNLNASGSLDLADNDLVVNSGAYTTIRAYVIQGLGASTTGIDSSTSTGETRLALFNNALLLTPFTSWNGAAIPTSAIVGKYTYFGDLNIDGQVTGDDYTVIDSNLNTTPPVGLEWLRGDANTDGNVTGDDYTVIDANLGSGVGNPLSTSALGSGLTPSYLNLVPEPTSLGAITLVGATGFCRRRRRT